MVQFTSLFLAAAFAVSSLASPALVIRDVAAVKQDIATLNTQVTQLDSQIDSYPASGGTLGGALTIHSTATTVVSTLNKATSDIGATDDVSDADGRDILDAVEALQPIIEHALTGIVAKKPAFDALPAGGVSTIVAGDLNSLATATSNFEDGLIAKAPASILDEATQVRTEIDAAFQSAIAAYS